MKESTKAFVKRMLKKVRLFDFAKMLYQKLCQVYDRITAKQRVQNFENEFADFYAKLNQADIQPGGIVSMGILCTLRKPTLIPFMMQMQKCFPKQQIVFLDESREEDALCPFPRFLIPRSVPVKFDRNVDLPVDEKVDALIREKGFLSDAVKNITGRLKNIKESYAKVLVYRSYEMYHFILDTWKPSEVIIWSEYNALHMVFAQVCKERGIEPIFMEFGVLPGTFSLERGGQMGRSFVATKWQEFLALPIDETELENARNVLSYLQKSGLNRNIQPSNNAMHHLERRLMQNRPIVLFAGQHDYDSGMVPYTEETAKYHSPVFASSVDAVRYIAELAKKNNWNFIFKPHPGMVNKYQEMGFPSNVIYLTDVNLNELIDKVDVVITLMSQTAYVSLIRGCAAVTMGYNQLRGKGCAYEAFSEDAVETQICRALDRGYTQQQREMFQRHIAQLLKYYLLDDMQERAVRYGQTPEQWKESSI